LLQVRKDLARQPTRAVINNLAARFGFEIHDCMQDWEWEVSDPDRIEEFLDAYASGDLGDDERFTLMETILESLEESGRQPESDSLWAMALENLETHIRLHASTVLYWSCLETDDLALAWTVAPFCRRILDNHRDLFEDDGSAPS